MLSQRKQSINWDLVNNQSGIRPGWNKQIAPLVIYCKQHLEDIDEIDGEMLKHLAGCAAMLQQRHKGFRDGPCMRESKASIHPIVSTGLLTMLNSTNSSRQVTLPKTVGALVTLFKVS